MVYIYTKRFIGNLDFTGLFYLVALLRDKVTCPGSPASDDRSGLGETEVPGHGEVGGAEMGVGSGRA